MSTIIVHKLWRRWVAVNGVGEMFGLGLTLALGAFVISQLGNAAGGKTILVSFLVSVSSGVIEATVVGLLQWWAMHPWFSQISRRAWWMATLIGALLAYVLGYLPSTIMSLGEQASPTQAAAEPAQWMVLLMAAGLGLAGGAVLSFAQWLILRKSVRGAGIWIPANMLAWMIGMPVIFWGIDRIQSIEGILWIILAMAGILLVTGLIVGMIHGVFLVRIAEVEPKSANSG